jgi:hypothetical protein
VLGVIIIGAKVTHLGVRKIGVKLLGYVGIDLELTVRGKDLSAVTIDAKLGANSNGTKSLFK